MQFNINCPITASAGLLAYKFACIVDVVLFLTSALNVIFNLLFQTCFQVINSKYQGDVDDPDAEQEVARPFLKIVLKITKKTWVNDEFFCCYNI